MRSIDIMNLKLLLEETGRTWTLKPNRPYVIGSSSDCDIALPHANAMAGRHCQVGFDVSAQCWYVEDLGTTQGTYINQQAIHKAQISGQTRIVIGGSVAVSAIPEGIPIAVAAPPQYASPQPANGYAAHSLHDTTARGSMSYVDKQYSRQNNDIQSSLRVLKWREYVAEHVALYESPWQRLVVWFYLTTGWRNTPWVKKHGQTGFDAFDGYVIPSFNGSVDSVITEIEKNLGKLTQYEDTDCFVANLTDAHIADSSIQSFAGVELFPIVRGRNVQKGDYRRFCVSSYHHVKNYLLVEKYGTDLFVGWITRFEPRPTSVIIGLWLALAILLSLFALPTGNVFIIAAPLVIWSVIHVLVPMIMEGMGILPKKANTFLLLAIILPITIAFIGAFAGAVAASSFFR